MKIEMTLTRRIHEKFGFPCRDAPVKRIDRDEGAGRRRAIRVETDGLIRQGLTARNLEEVAVGIAGSMTAVAGACLQFGVEPTSDDLVTAGRELLEDARLVIDNGIQISELDQVTAGAVMVGLVCAGLSVSLGIPYAEVLNLFVDAAVDGKPVDREVVRSAIARHKAASPEPSPDVSRAANDAAAPQDEATAGQESEEREKTGADKGPSTE